VVGSFSPRRHGGHGENKQEIRKRLRKSVRKKSKENKLRVLRVSVVNTLWEIEESTMQDLLFVAVTIAFFALSLGYVTFCDRIK